MVIVLLVAGLSAGMLAQARPPASPDVLLRAAMQKEQIDNDLAAAIAEYKVIVDRFPKDAAAPKALFQMASIYQRLGQVAAEHEVWSRIARDYPTSGAPAAAARQRLGTATSSGFKETELIPTGKADRMLGDGRVSPDGRYISWGDQLIESAGGTGNLAIWDTRSGQTTIVNKYSNTKPWADGAADNSAWSPDGRALAYAWRPGGGVRELRIVDRQTGRHRVVFRAAEGVTWLEPLAFSPDGLQVLASAIVSAGEGTVRSSELLLVAVADGSSRVLKVFNRTSPGGGTFSPDGRSVAYDIQPDGDSPSRDIEILDVASGTARRLVDLRSAHDRMLGWFHDGHLLFTSDRDGSTDAWVVRVENGAPLEAPIVVRRNVGQLRTQGITRDGRVFVLKDIEVREIYVAELDLVTGKAVRPPVPLARTQPTVKRGEPAFSPDGSRLAYVQSAPGVPQSVVVQVRATSELRVYPVRVRNIDWPRWHPQGHAFIFDGTGADNVQRTFSLDLASGRVDALVDNIVFGIAPDGQSVYMRGGNGIGLVRRYLADGKIESIAPAAEGGVGTTLSPDGRWLAFLSRGGARGGASLLIRPATGGPARVLTQGFAAGYARLAWSPDSRYVIFNDNPTGLNRVSVDGGPREPLGITARGLGVIREKTMSADGRHLAFGVAGGRTELWVWENVVPKGKQP